jgi:hypothetical protein
VASAEGLEVVVDELPIHASLADAS